MEKIIKARKDHTCGVCLRPIAAGEEYLLCNHRTARYDENDKQIGVDFYRYRRHIIDEGDVSCGAPEDCRKGDHPKYVYESGYNGDNLSGQKEGYYCEDCGHYLTEEEYKKEYSI